MHSIAISDIFTVINKVLVMLLIENDEDDFNNMINLKHKLTRKNCDQGTPNQRTGMKVFGVGRERVFRGLTNW